MKKTAPLSAGYSDGAGQGRALGGAVGRYKRVGGGYCRRGTHK